MKYKCLVFDHDDTVVNSTASIHHPCFNEYLKLRRPGMSCSYEQYMLYNFDPGFLGMAREVYGMTDEDLADELVFWQSYVKDHIPKAYDGIGDIMRRHKENGGIIAVVSHSYEHYILRDYEHNDLPKPDAVYGWGRPEHERKPNPFPLEDIMRTFDLKPEELVMIDDLKPGYDMAMACGVDFAAVGWSYDLESIEKFMRSNCSNYFKSVPELAAFLEE